MGLMPFNVGLVSIDYHPGIRSVRMVYEPDSEYDLSEILAYVHDMTGGTSRQVEIFEGDKLMHNIKHMGNAGWVNIAKGQGNGL